MALGMIGEPEAIEPLLEKVRARLGEPRRTLRQISHFFETPQDHLAKAKLSLRVREECDLAGGEASDLGRADVR